MKNHRNEERIINDDLEERKESFWNILEALARASDIFFYRKQHK
jgi:hypothetical protein